MIYSDYILKAKELTIGYNEEAMVYYLEPEWQTILHDNNLGNLEDVKDMYIEGWYDLEDVLKLEVEKRNAITSKKNLVYDWIYNVISSSADPLLTDAENDLFQLFLGAKKAENQQSVPK